MAVLPALLPFLLGETDEFNFGDAAGTVHVLRGQPRVNVIAADNRRNQAE